MNLRNLCQEVLQRTLTFILYPKPVYPGAFPDPKYILSSHPPQSKGFCHFSWELTMITYYETINQAIRKI